MKDKTIEMVIFVRGGVVQEVISNQPNTEVKIVDFDDLDSQEKVHIPSIKEAKMHKVY